MVTDLGKVAITPKGVFIQNTIYEKLDLVEFNGSSYLSRIDNNNQILTNQIAWLKVASKGDQGIQGIQGDTGYKTIGAEPINLSTPAPTVEGWYKPTQNGTYTNYGGYTKEQGKMLLIKFTPPNIFTKDEEPLTQTTKSIPQFADLSFPVANTTTEKVQCVDNFVLYQLLDGKTSTSVNAPSTSPTIWKVVGSNQNGVIIPFSPSIYFNNNLSISTKTVNAPITFIPTVNESTILGGSTLVRLIADGTNTPNFSNFKKLNGSQDYSNIAGKLNVCYFFYDGIDAWVNIWQGIGNSNIVTNDTTSPTAPTLSSSNITENSVILAWSGATDNTAVVAYEVYKDGVLLETVSASPYTVTGLSASTTYAFTVKAKDAAGNTSVSSNSISITTLAITTVNVVFDSLSGATYNSGNNTLSSSSQSTGGLRTTPITGDFEIRSENTMSSASVIALKQNTTGGYVWIGGTPSFLISSFFVDNKIIVSINGSTSVFQAQVSTTDTKIKMKRVGNDCLIYTSADDVNWTLRHTQTGVFSGITNIFVQGIFAITQANTMSLKLKQL